MCFATCKPLPDPTYAGRCSTRLAQHKQGALLAHDSTCVVRVGCCCLQIGSVNNTFGVPGVNEHCYFLKSLEDAHDLRTHVTECFERAALPHVSRRRGGGAPHTYRAYTPLFFGTQLAHSFNSAWGRSYIAHAHKVDSRWLLHAWLYSPSCCKPAAGVARGARPPAVVCGVWWRPHWRGGGCRAARHGVS